MNDAQKKRVNLYIDQELLDFGKRFGYVTGQSLSGLVEGFLRSEEEKVKLLSAESYLQFKNEQEEEWFNCSGKRAKCEDSSIEEYLRDVAEVEYCNNNPESIRAKLRIQLIKEQEERNRQELEREARQRKKQEQARQAFIKRWNETFK